MTSGTWDLALLNMQTKGEENNPHPPSAQDGRWRFTDDDKATSRKLSMKYGRQSTEGGARGGRISVDGACSQEPDSDTRRRDSDLDRFGPSDRRNTLRSLSLVYCIEIYTD